MSSTAWLTYSWKDNEGPQQDDVDFLIQEIQRRGIDVHYDRRDLIAGRPLWPQIEQKISNPAECDAWIFLVTATSLSSKPCIEELLYAVDRALDAKRGDFPLVGLVHGPRPSSLPVRPENFVSTGPDGSRKGMSAGGDEPGDLLEPPARPSTHAERTRDAPSRLGRPWSGGG